MDDQLQQLINLQTEQNQLLKRYLWRLRFSLLTILLMMTGVCIGLGCLVYATKSKPAQPTLTLTTPPSIYAPQGASYYAAPVPNPVSPPPPAEDPFK
jgi:hypothetical protein